VEERVLLLALRGRDAEIIARLLRRQGLKGHVCGSVSEVAEQLYLGAGTALITEESLRDAPTKALEAWIDSQEPGSDFPFILLATKRHGRRPVEALRTLNMLGNVVVLELPIHAETLTSAVDSALRGRLRQYDARARLTDVGRLGNLLDRAADTMLHVDLERVSPLAVPLLVMIGRESVAQGSVDDELLMEAESLAGIAMTP